MHKMLVLYNAPKDPAHFKKYYAETHVPMAAKLPGLKAHRYSFDVHGIGGTSPYFCVFEAEFADAAAMAAAMSSDLGKKVGADTANYASGGFKIIHYAVQ